MIIIIVVHLLFFFYLVLFRPMNINHQANESYCFIPSSGIINYLLDLFLYKQTVYFETVGELEFQ